MKVYPAILCFMFFLSSSAISQKTEIDSLENLLPILNHDTSRVIVLNRLARIFRNTYPNKGCTYGKEALSIARKIKYAKGEINANYQLGVIYKYLPEVKRNDSISISHLENSISQAKQINKFGLTARGYTAWGNSNIFIEEKIKAFENALKYAGLAKDEKRTIRAMYSLSLTYQEQRNSLESIKLIEEAITRAEAINYNSLLAEMYSSIGVHIQQHKSQNNFLRAESYGDKALSMVNKENEPDRWARYAFNAILAKARLKKLEEAITLADAGIEIYKKYNNERFRGFEQKKGQAYYINDRPQKAIPLLLQSLEYPKYSNSVGDLIALSKCYAQIGNYDSAYYYADSSRILVKENYGNLNTSLVAELNAKYHATEKEAKIAQQKLQLSKEKNDKKNILFGGILALLAASSIYFWYFQLQKRKKLIAEGALLVEQEKLENIRALDRLKDQFFTNISHELRTPLTLITDPLGKVLQKPITELDHDDIELAHRNSHKLLALINEIMDLSKLDAKKVTIKKSTIHINNALRRQLMAFESLASIRNISLSFQSTVTDDLQFQTDYKLLEKIINNLVSNAIKFSNIDDEIVLSVNIVNNNCLIKISDTGIGISPSDQKQIFNRFYQGEQQSYQGGTGVGLALSKALSELLGGELRVESELNLGSTFTLTLPYREVKEASITTILPKGNDVVLHYESLMIDGEKPRILIVEDNEDMSKYIHRLLTDSYRCTVVLNGINALQEMQKNKYDLILSDVMMPGMDGFELRRKSLLIFKNETIPYVFLTARSLEDDILKGLRLGVDDYITKPFNSDELKIRIHNLIKNKIERDVWNASEGIVTINLDEAEDTRFIKSLEKSILEHISESDFNVEILAKKQSLSTRQLGRRTKAITGLTPVAFILEMRLQKARQLIERRTFNNLADIRYEVGIESSSYFSKKYKSRFGVSPREVMNM